MSTEITAPITIAPVEISAPITVSPIVIDAPISGGGGTGTGPQGEPGEPGEDGKLSYLSFIYRTDTTMADPMEGNFRLNHATPTSATQLAINDIDDDGNDLSWVLSCMDAQGPGIGATGPKGSIMLVDDDGNGLTFHVEDLVDQSDWWLANISAVTDAGSGLTTAAHSFLFSLNGQDGADGPAGATGADGSPGAGVSWQGAWGIGTAYAENDGVEHNGSAWIANAITIAGEEPGVNGKWDLWVEKGDPGEDGVDGATGPAGADGNDGAAGATGPAGADGADSTVPGPTGATGATGAAGADGAPGADGTNGTDGSDGATGPAGADGADGVGWSPPAFIIHNSGGVVAENVSRKAIIPTGPTSIDAWYVTCYDENGDVITTSQTVSIEIRQKTWTTGAWTDTATGDKLTGTQPSYSAAAPSSLNASPNLGAINAGEFLQVGVLSVTGTDIKTVEVILDVS